MDMLVTIDNKGIWYFRANTISFIPPSLYNKLLDQYKFYGQPILLLKNPTTEEARSLGITGI